MSGLQTKQKFEDWIVLYKKSNKLAKEGIEQFDEDECKNLTWKLLS